MAGQSRLPRRIIQIQQPRRTGFVDRVDPPARRRSLGPRVILIGDPGPTGQPRRRHLIVEHHRGIGDIVEQGFQTSVEKRQPMLHALMLAPRRDRLIQWIIEPGSAEFDPVILAKAGDGGVIKDHL